MRMLSRLTSLLFVSAFLLGPSAAGAGDATAAPTTVPPGPMIVVSGGIAPSYVIANGQGVAQLLVNASTGSPEAAVSHLRLLPGASVPSHNHPESVELLYVETGTAEMTVAGRVYTVKAGDAAYIPKGVEHSARVTSRFEAFSAVQIYVGPGPEQRFAKGELLPAGRREPAGP